MCDHCQSPREMEKVYNPKEVENRLYQYWLDKRHFHSEPNKDKKPFTIVMPPPNITGQLHMGHALDVALQDSLTRAKRMQGYEALWLPGTDHASIATEVKIVDQMREEGLTKQDLGREGFLQRAWQWRNTYGGRIVEQLKKLGSSCDWERERFTMDEGCSKAVTEVFVKMAEEGLIYRGNRIINWCPDCLTALSDAEVEYEESASHLWHIRYPAADGGEGVIVATTRPETMLGDTAVAVNPNDPRYAHLIGKNVVLPLMDKEIPVVADEYVEMEFGTGAVKITPAHDPNDFEVARRHDLPIIKVMHDNAVMNDKAGKYAGLTREQCRKQVVKDLQEIDLMVKIEDYSHNVGTCYRCHKVVEPMLSMQWFVKMQPLAEPAIEAVRTGKTRFIPDRFDKTYFNWMENIRDWCISRQLWWGHRIPAWYCQDCDETIIARTAPTACTKCGGTHLKQDEDVLDTWFSSALWPFSTLGWPDKTPELAYYYPTSTLVTGYDIIFFWVARMVFSGIKHMGEVPFNDVFIHGIVRDSQGRKMSKSLGNGIDPLEVIDQFGADALRFSLTIGVSPGSDMRYYPDKVESSRNFCNKIWNAARFVLMNVKEDGVKSLSEVLDDLSLSDKWILEEFARLSGEVTTNIDSYELGLATQKLYDFIWSQFCDWTIELAKPRLYSEDETAKQTALAVLVHVLTGSLKLLHPFMPFITEEIFQNLPRLKGDQDSIMISAWPDAQQMPRFAKEAEAMNGVMEIVRAVRNVRAEMNVAPGRSTRLILSPAAGWEDALRDAAGVFQRLAYASEVDFGQGPEDAVAVVTTAAQAFLPLAELVDIEKELARLNKELENTLKEIARGEGKLNNAGFVSKAPAAVVEEERGKLDKQRQLEVTLRERLTNLQAIKERNA